MSKLDRNEVKEQFLKDTANHSMNVLLDNGVYRHLSFTNNGSNVYRFDITTWPGHLCISGDMGTQVFSRLHDMFNFFNGSLDDQFPINPDYWGEKLQAIGTNAGYKEYSQDLFAENVKEEYDQFVEDYDLEKSSAQDLWESLSDSVLVNSHDGGVRAYDAAMNFEWESDDGTHEFNMHDFWEHNNEDHTYHYIWALYAIVYGIGQYNGVKYDVGEVEEVPGC